MVESFDSSRHPTSTTPAAFRSRKWTSGNRQQKRIAIRNRFSTPEEINDSPATAPSKRVESLVPRYQKPLMGTLAAQQVGLAAIRKACPHFDNWVRTLEHVGT